MKLGPDMYHPDTFHVPKCEAVIEGRQRAQQKKH